MPKVYFGTAAANNSWWQQLLVATTLGGRKCTCPYPVQTCIALAWPRLEYMTCVVLAWPRLERMYLPGHAWSIHDRVGHKWWKGRASSKSKPKLFQINISALASELAQPLLVVLASPGCTLHSRKLPVAF